MRVRRRLALAALGAVVLLSALLAASCFDTALRAGELWPWLISQEAPGAEGAMITLEEKQFQWALAGGVCLLPGLGALAGEVWLFQRIRRNKREGDL